MRQKRSQLMIWEWNLDVNAFKQKVLPLHEKMLNENPKIRDLYEHIQEANEAAAGKEGK